MTATQVQELLDETASFPVELHTDRLVLREFSHDDLSSMQSIVGDDRVTRWLSFDSRTRAQTETMLAGVLERQHAEPRTEFYMAVVDPDDRENILGFARLGLGGVQAADLGYAIRPEAQGRGYAREAAVAMIDFGFHKLGLHRITANIGPENVASLRLVRSLGFTQEGTIRDHVYTNGAWRDSESYSILAHEWSAPPCTYCGGRMLPTPRGARPRVYCSSRCRQAAYRDRLRD